MSGRCGFYVPDGTASHEPRTPRVSLEELPAGRPPMLFRRSGSLLDGALFGGTSRGTPRRSFRSPRVGVSPRVTASPRVEREQLRTAKGGSSVAEETGPLVNIPLHQIMEIPRGSRQEGRGSGEGSGPDLLSRTRSTPVQVFAPPRYHAKSLEGNIIPASPLSASPSPQCPPSAQPAQSFSNLYEVHEKLGAGSYGEVFKATEKATGRQVAVKTINMRTDRCNPQRVRLEVAMLKRLVENKLVAKFYKTVEEGQNLHIILELCSGGDLRDYILENGPLNETQASLVAYQVLLLLCDLHKARIVHGDVKPANFVITNKLGYHLFKCGLHLLPHGWLKAVDFGCSQHTGKGRIQHRIGTPSHWAPEVFGETYHLESDLWSTGVLVYELLVGRLPFCTNKEHQRMRSERDMLKALMFKEPDFKCKELKGVSPECLDFLKRLLMKNHKNRMTVDEALEHKWMKKHFRVQKGTEKQVLEGLLRRRSWSVPVVC